MMRSDGSASFGELFVGFCKRTRVVGDAAALRVCRTHQMVCQFARLVSDFASHVREFFSAPLGISFMNLHGCILEVRLFADRIPGGKSQLVGGAFVVAVLIPIAVMKRDED